MDHSVTKRGLESGLKAQKTYIEVSRISSLQRWRLESIYRPHSKTSRFLAVGIPDTSGMNTASTVLKIGPLEAARGVGTPDSCQDIRLLLGLPTNQTENIKEVVAARPIPDTSGISSHNKVKLVLVSLSHTHFTWIGLSTYE